MSIALVVGGVLVATGTLNGEPGPAIGEVAGAIATPDPTDIGGPIFPSAAPEATSTPSDDGNTPAVAAASPAGAGTTVVAKPKHGPDPATLTGYRWPLPNARLTLPFGPSPWGSHLVDGKDFHDGLDLATFCGDRIVAAHKGTVLAAGRRFDSQIGWIGNLGPYTRRLDQNHLWNTLPIVIVIDDGNGYRSMYAHFSRIAVTKGQTVKAGQFLGYEGATGHASGCHLHYGLFSPQETDRFGIDAAVAKRMKLPHNVIARIDPRLVLPDRKKAVKASEVPSDTSP